MTNQDTKFEDWIEAVKKAAKDNHNFSDSDLNTIDFEIDFWEEMYHKGLTPNQALIEDQNQE